jgi:hypothetical protein
VFSVQRFRDLNLPIGWSIEINDLAGPNGTEHLLCIVCSVAGLSRIRSVLAAIAAAPILIVHLQSAVLRRFVGPAVLISSAI